MTPGPADIAALPHAEDFKRAIASLDDPALADVYDVCLNRHHLVRAQTIREEIVARFFQRRDSGQFTLFDELPRGVAAKT